ncbi:MAG TPA: hypothetical protein VF194_14490 [Ferrovibrio sp.]|uniref:hypothetical protein n=1 Tax=Ferrovibrio sp. TaxID=1917215 RepID=UPI002ED4C6AD
MTSIFDHDPWERPDRRSWTAILLSLLLHILIVVVLISEPWAWHMPRPQPPILAEFVVPEAPKPTATPAAQPQKPPPSQAEQPILPPAPKPPETPQLQRGAKVDQESRSAPGAGDKAQTQSQATSEPKPPVAPAAKPQAKAEAAPQGRKAQPKAPSQAGNRTAGTANGGAGKTGTEMTQSESDFFLSQIVEAWVIDFRAPQFRNIQIYGNYKVLPNGMLAPPFGKNDPWDMNAMVTNWDEVENTPNAAAFRTAIETFLRAMRLAQPFKMPPNADGYPKVLSLNFRLGDL